MNSNGRSLSLSAISLIVTASLVLGACGSSGSGGNGGLTETSTCNDYNNADRATQDRFAQDEINRYHSHLGVADVEGNFGYNCSQNIDRTLKSLLPGAVG